MDKKKARPVTIAFIVIVMIDSSMNSIRQCILYVSSMWYDRLRIIIGRNDNKNGSTRVIG